VGLFEELHGSDVHLSSLDGQVEEFLRVEVDIN
jgi:hypothetical protein